MVIGRTVGIQAIIDKVKFGKSEIYPNNNIVTGGLTKAYLGMGGERNFGLANSQQPASVNGRIKKIISQVTLDGGGRMDYWTVVNGAEVLAGSNPGVGVVTLDVDIPFVKDDLIACSFLRNDSNLTFDHRDIIEIEWDDPLGQDIKHYYGFIERNGNLVNNGWLGIAPSTLNTDISQFPLTDEEERKWKMPRSGTVLDMVYYGKIPVSIDRPNAEFALRINGADANVQIPTQHAGFAIERFDGINIPFAKGDELNFRILGASTTLACEGSGNARIEFD